MNSGSLADSQYRPPFLISVFFLTSCNAEVETVNFDYDSITVWLLSILRHYEMGGKKAAQLVSPDEDADKEEAEEEGGL